MPYSISTHLEFNAWANEQFAGLLRTVPETIYFQENTSSFSSLAKTTGHIWGAQNIWLQRMTGNSSSHDPTAQFISDREATLNGLVESSYSLLAFANVKTGAELDNSFAYKNLKGEPFESRYIDTLFHVVNHSTYHRGQIITLLRAAGITSVVSTDLIHYLRTRKSM